jgi:glycosyltransferase involved in cell wall biosynthesis
MSPTIASAGQRRILYVVNESYFFVSHRLKIGLAARDAGFDVHIAAPRDHVWAPRGFQSGVLADQGFTLHEIPLSRRGVNPLREAATLRDLVSLYRTLRPALVHHMTIKPVLYGTLAARIAKVPIVVNLVTGLGQIFTAQDRTASLLRGLAVVGYRIAAGHPNAWTVFQNREDRNRLIALHAVDAARSSLVKGSGVDLTVFRPVSEPHGTPVVLLPARLLWEKGVGVFAEAGRILQSRGVDVRLRVVGDTQPSNPRSVPEAELRSWTQKGFLEWEGRCDDMPAALAAAHVVCLPSSYGEGVPKVLLEAAAAGRPVVATDIAGCREVVRPGVTGLLVPPGDPTLLADAIALLALNRDMRVRMGNEARALAEAEFSDALVAEQTLTLYDRLRTEAHL